MIDSTRKYYQFLLQLAAITALWLIANSAAFGKLPDTLIAPEIEVVAEKLPDEPALKIFSVKTINRASLNTLAPTGSLSEALVYAQGVTLKDYGGEFGAKTLSLRGTTAAQSLVVFEGFKLNSAESGAFDISSLPVQTLSNARVVLGGASALFGSGSIGGALLLELADENSEKEAHSLTLSLGSFGSKKMTFSASMPFGKSSVFAALRYSKSDGNYPIDVLHYGKSQEISRDNADYSGFSSLVAYTSGSGTNELLKIFVMLNSGERGSPGAVIQGNIENTTARLFQKGAVASFSFTKLLSKSIIYKARLAFKATKDDYSDSIGVLPTHNSYFNKELQASAALNYSFLGINTIFNCDLVYSTLNSDMLLKEQGGFVSRMQTGAAFRIENEGTVLNILDYGLYGGIRYDGSNDAAANSSFFSGMKLGVSGSDFFVIRANWSKNYRLPSFNELYYFNYGNKNLLPETSVSLSCGADFMLINYSAQKSFRFGLSAEAFKIETDNQIQSTPYKQMLWKAENIGSSKNYGFDIGFYAGFINDFITISGSYSRQKPIDNETKSLTNGKILIYLPQETASIIAGLKYSRFSANLTTRFSGFMFTTRDNNPKYIIPSYTIVNLMLDYMFELYYSRLNLRFDVLNFFDKRYSTILNYPCEGRSFHVGLSVIL